MAYQRSKVRVREDVAVVGVEKGIAVDSELWRRQMVTDIFCTEN